MQKLISFIFLVTFSAIVFAQAPQGINYQAVVRNTSGTIFSNQQVGIRLSIHQNAANGTVVYQESHQPTTNALGLVNLVIGNGTASTGVFSNINWSIGPYFVEVAVDISGGSNYITLGA